MIRTYRFQRSVFYNLIPGWVKGWSEPIELFNNTDIGLAYICRPHSQTIRVEIC